MMYGNGQGRATGKEPVDRVIDLFVHMPIGFAVMAWKRVPEFVVSVPELVGQVVAKGCAQIAEAEGRLSEEVRKARMIGQVAVTFGGRQVRREVDARLADARRKAGGAAGYIPGVGSDGGSNGAGARPGGGPVTATATPTAPSSPAAGPAEAASKPTGARPATKAATAKATRAGTAAKAARATKAGTAAKATKSSAAAKAAKATTPAKGPRRPAAHTAGATSAADLPIPEYDGLSASQVVSRLSGLTPDELRAVRAYEEGSRSRRTVLLAIDRLLG